MRWAFGTGSRRRRGKGVIVGKVGVLEVRCTALVMDLGWSWIDADILKVLREEHSVPEKRDMSAAQAQLPTPPTTPRKKTPTKKVGAGGSRVGKKGVGKLKLGVKKRGKVGSRKR